MTFIETTLPATLTLVFKGDDELYTCLLTAIEDVNADADTCVLVCEELLPHTARFTMPYSMLNASAVHLDTGIHLFLSSDEAEAYVQEQKASQG